MNSEISAVPPYDTSGSGTPTTGSTPLTIAMLTNAYVKNISVIAPAMSRANIVEAFAVITIAAADQQQVEHEQDRVADQPEFLAEHGEDEIGVALRQEVEVRLRAVQPALADDAARAERDRRLRRVIAGAERIATRIEERQDPLALIVVQLRPDERADRRGEREQSDDDLPRQPGEEQHVEARRADQ